MEPSSLILPRPAAIVEGQKDTRSPRNSPPTNRPFTRPLTRQIPRAKAISQSQQASEGEIEDRISTGAALMLSPHLSPAGRAALQKRQDQLKTELELVRARKGLENASLSQSPPESSSVWLARAQKDSQRSPESSRTHALSMQESIKLQQADVKRAKEDEYAAMMASLRLEQRSQEARDLREATQNSEGLVDSLERAKMAAMAGFLWHRDSDSEEEDGVSDFDFGLDDEHEIQMEQDGDNG